MRIDMGLDCFELKRFHQGFKFQLIHLLSSGYRHIMIDEVDAVPDEEVDERRKNICTDGLQEGQL